MLPLSSNRTLVEYCDRMTGLVIARIEITPPDVDVGVILTPIRGSNNYIPICLYKNAMIILNGHIEYILEGEEVEVGVDPTHNHQSLTVLIKRGKGILIVQVVDIKNEMVAEREIGVMKQMLIGNLSTVDHLLDIN